MRQGGDKGEGGVKGSGGLRPLGDVVKGGDERGVIVDGWRVRAEVAADFVGRIHSSDALDVQLSPCPRRSYRVALSFGEAARR